MIGLDHLLDYDMTTNCTPYMLSCYSEYWNKELESCSSSVV